MFRVAIEQFKNRGAIQWTGTLEVKLTSVNLHTLNTFFQDLCYHHIKYKNIM